MTGKTSIGSTESKPEAADEEDEAQATIEGVDAHHTNEIEMRRGLAGVEAKPFSKRAPAPDKLDVSVPSNPTGNDKDNEK